MSEAQKKVFPSSESDADSPEEEVCSSEDGSHTVAQRMEVIAQWMRFAAHGPTSKAPWLISLDQRVTSYHCSVHTILMLIIM
jgi:hypothetical protein